MKPKYYILIIILTLAGIVYYFLTKQPIPTFTSPTTPSSVPEIFKEYIAKNKIDENLIRDIIVGKPVDALVSFYYNDIEKDAEKIRRMSGVNEDTPEIRKQIAELIKERKSKVLSRLKQKEDYEIIEDYQHFAVTFIRFYNQEAILKLLQDPMVLSIKENKSYKLQ